MTTRVCFMWRALGYVALAASMAGCASTGTGLKPDVASQRRQYSGFLSDYSQLSKVIDSRGNEVLRWINPDVNLRNYSKIIVAMPALYPQPTASAQVSAQVLDEIRTYGRKRLQDELAQAGMLGEQPGPGVMRANIALTGVASEAQQLQAWEVIPVALIKAGIESATGARERDVRIFIEAEVVDSVTNQVLARNVHEGTGVPLHGSQEQLTIEHIKPKIDQWAAAVVEEAARLLE